MAPISFLRHTVRVLASCFYKHRKLPLFCAFALLTSLESATTQIGQSRPSGARVIVCLLRNTYISRRSGGAGLGCASVRFVMSHSCNQFSPSVVWNSRPVPTAG